MSVVSRIHRALTGRIAMVAAAAALLAACSSSAGGGPGAASTSTPAPVAQASDKYPNSIVVLGHSGATGYDSDPKAPETDATQNSWATGDNPKIRSIYLRLLALNPAVRGHNTNLAVDGTGVGELAGQADKALATTPLPELFLIQSVDNDMRCDGTDADNYALFAAALTEVLKKITSGAPKAKILIVSSPWATVQNYGQVAAQPRPAGGQQRHRTPTSSTPQASPCPPTGAPWRASPALPRRAQVGVRQVPGLPVRQRRAVPHEDHHRRHHHQRRFPSHDRRPPQAGRPRMACWDCLIAAARGKLD
jgi:hypothetical protein